VVEVEVVVLEEDLDVVEVELVEEVDVVWRRGVGAPTAAPATN
jgi:hypothetical protein